MYELVYVVQKMLLLFIEVLSVAMLIRALLSWLPLDEDSKLAIFFYFVTEPMIMPLRMLCDRFGWGRSSPIDLPFLMTSLLLLLLYLVVSML